MNFAGHMYSQYLFPKPNDTMRVKVSMCKYKEMLFKRELIYELWDAEKDVI